MNTIEKISAEAIRIFETSANADEINSFKNNISLIRKNTVFSAKDIFEGVINADELFLIDIDALEFGMHFYREIYDILIDADNGRIIFDTERGLYAARPFELIAATAPTLSHPTRKLDSTFTPPPHMTIGNGIEIEGETLSHKDHGAINVLHAPQYQAQWIVVWRSDRRRTIQTTTISAHSKKEYAFEAARKAAINFDAPTQSRSKKIRDLQRQRVYQWENLIAMKSGVGTEIQLKDFDSCKSYLVGVCKELGIKAPQIEKAHGNSETSSYKLGTIRMHSGQLDKWTVLHELAHHISDRIAIKTRRKESGHGPTFVGILAVLLNEKLEIDMELMRKNAQENNVEINEEIIEKMNYRLEKERVERQIIR